MKNDDPIQVIVTVCVNGTA